MIIREQIDPRRLAKDTVYEVMIKAKYARNPNFHNKQLYIDHIRVLNGAIEPDRSGKTNIDHFVLAFNQLINRMRTTGFWSHHPIDVTEDYDLLTGTHRVAAAIACDIEEIPINRHMGVHRPQNRTPMYFRRRGFPDRRWLMWLTYWRLRLMRLLCPGWLESWIVSYTENESLQTIENE